MGGGKKTCKREEFITIEKFKDDFLVAKNVKADVITFSGTGEPTLAKNIGEMIRHVKSVSNLPVGILTNSYLLSDPDVKEQLYPLDFVVAKLDAYDEDSFKNINRPHGDISFKDYIQGIKEFRKNYRGKFALQIMFIDSNKGHVQEIVEIAKDLAPDEVQINTPLRKCAVNPLTEKEIRQIMSAFKGFKRTISVYDSEKPSVIPIDIKEVRKRKRFYS